MKVIIVGGGVIGAALAHNLRDRGADVAVFAFGSGATTASFGWVNANFYHDAHHFHFRQAGLEAWRRLGDLVRWQGCLCCENDGDAFDKQKRTLEGIGYSVEELSAGEISNLEPNVVAPKRALLFASEGIVEPQTIASKFLKGVRTVFGVSVSGVSTQAGRVTGITTSLGTIDADRVIICAGTGSSAILQSVEVSMPLLDRPGLILRTEPIQPVFSNILAMPGQELRQDESGCIWAPTAAQHQSDTATFIDARPEVLADAALSRIQKILPRQIFKWDQVTLAHRPVPADGLPALGHCGPGGLFAAVMHSGVTLAAITAEVLAPQVLGQALTNAQADLVAPYSLNRFQSIVS